MDFTINKTVYRSGKLDAFTQLHIVRRLTPCIGKLAGLVGGGVKIKFDDKGNIVDFDGDMDAVIMPLTEALTALNDADVEYILNACLAVTERKQPGGSWARLRVGDTTMFDGLTLPMLIQVAYYVIMENLEVFFGELPSFSGLQGFLKAKGLAG